MTDQRVAHSAPKATTTLGDLADALEEEIARLRRLRPALSERIDRAANILVTHFSCQRSHTIKARVGADGKVRFLVSGSKGATYVVEPNSWSCTCPDAHRSGLSVCKHGLSCYLLVKAVPSKRTRAKARPCSGCGETMPRRDLREVQHEDNSELWFPGDLLCGTCSDRTGVER